MKDLIKNMVALGVSISLSDREAFVEKVSGIISEYQANPEKAEKWAGAITQFIEERKEDLRTQRIIENSIINSDMPDRKSIDGLTRAIEGLTSALNQKKDK